MDETWNLGKPVLLLDGGDLFGKRAVLDQQQTRFLAEVTGTFGYDAIGLGEWDLNYGLPFLREMIRTHGLPFTNANVRLAETGELILPPYLIVEKGGTTFGIISVLEPEHKIVTMAAKDTEFVVDDPIETLRKIIPEIRQKAECIIVLGHQGDRQTEAMAKEVEGIDITVVGHTFRTFQDERVVGKTVMLAAGYDGRFVGKADLDVEKDTGRIMAFTVDMISLDDSIASDPVVSEQVDAFKEELAAFKLEMRGKYKPTKGSDKEQFLTQRSCQKCHGDVWDKMRTQGHESAFASLGRKGQSGNPECVVCHVTGYLYKNGYDEQPPYNRLANVQCEACHGYGTQHKRDGSMLKIARASCVECHDKDNSPEFDYATYWEKIEH